MARAATTGGMDERTGRASPFETRRGGTIPTIPTSQLSVGPDTSMTSSILPPGSSVGGLVEPPGGGAGAAEAAAGPGALSGHA